MFDSERGELGPYQLDASAGPALQHNERVEPRNAASAVPARPMSRSARPVAD